MGILVVMVSTSVLRPSNLPVGVLSGVFVLSYRYVLSPTTMYVPSLPTSTVGSLLCTGLGVSFSNVLLEHPIVLSSQRLWFLIGLPYPPFV